MKQINSRVTFKSFVALFVLLLIQTITWAQDGTNESSSSVTKTTTTTTEWYTQPWVWVVGAAVLILLLVALLRGNSGGATASRTDRVTVTKTTDRDVV